MASSRPRTSSAASKLLGDLAGERVVRGPSAAPGAHRPRLFYGWYVVGVLMIGGILGAGTTNLFMAIMLKPLTESFDWSRTAVSGAITAAVVAGGLASPIFGRITDRYGPRLLCGVGALVIAGAYFGLAGLTELWQFYVLAVIGRMVTTGVLGGVASVTAAANWFRRYRGRAIGLVTLSTPLGGAALALIGQAIIDVSDWRTVWVVFGVATLVLVLVPSLLVLRRRPEDLGLLPDGEPVPAPESPAKPGAAPAATADAAGWSFREAARTAAFWLLAIAFLILNLATGAVAFHQVAYYTDIGIATGAAALALSVSALSAAVGSALWGDLIDRYPERLLNATAMTLAAVAMLIFLLVPTVAGIFIAATLYGITARGSNSLLFGTLARYYGRAAYGTISGVANQFQAIGVGVGPLIASGVFDRTGSYHDAFAIFAGFYVFAALLLALAKRPSPSRLRPATD